MSSVLERYKMPRSHPKLVRMGCVWIIKKQDPTILGKVRHEFYDMCTYYIYIYIFMLFYIVLSIYIYANMLLLILKIGPKKVTLKKKHPTIKRGNCNGEDKSGSQKMFPVSNLPLLLQLKGTPYGPRSNCDVPKNGHAVVPRDVARRIGQLGGEQLRFMDRSQACQDGRWMDGYGWGWWWWWWFSKGNLLFEGKSMLVKYISLARWRMFDTDDSSDNIVKFLLVSFGGWFHHKAAGDKWIISQMGRLWGPEKGGHHWLDSLIEWANRKQQRCMFFKQKVFLEPQKRLQLSSHCCRGWNGKSVDSKRVPSRTWNRNKPTS